MKQKMYVNLIDTQAEMREKKERHLEITIVDEIKKAFKISSPIEIKKQKLAYRTFRSKSGKGFHLNRGKSNKYFLIRNNIVTKDGRKFLIDIRTRIDDSHKEEPLHLNIDATIEYIGVKRKSMKIDKELHFTTIKQDYMHTCFLSISTGNGRGIVIPIVITFDEKASNYVKATKKCMKDGWKGENLIGVKKAFDEFVEHLEREGYYEKVKKKI